MKRVQFKTVAGADVRLREGYITIRGDDGKGGVEAKIDVKPFLDVAGLVLSGKRSLEDRANANLMKTAPGPGIQPVALSEYETIDLVDLPMSRPPACALVFDRGTERQLAFPMTTEQARQLSQALAEIALEIERPPSGPKN